MTYTTQALNGQLRRFQVCAQDAGFVTRASHLPRRLLRDSLSTGSCGGFSPRLGHTFSPGASHSPGSLSLSNTHVVTRLAFDVGAELRARCLLRGTVVSDRSTRLRGTPRRGRSSAPTSTARRVVRWESTARLYTRPLPHRGAPCGENGPSAFSASIFPTPRAFFLPAPGSFARPAPRTAAQWTTRNEFYDAGT